MYTSLTNGVRHMSLAGPPAALLHSPVMAGESQSSSSRLQHMFPRDEYDLISAHSYLSLCEFMHMKNIFSPPVDAGQMVFPLNPSMRQYESSRLRRSFSNVRMSSVLSEKELVYGDLNADTLTASESKESTPDEHPMVMAGSRNRIMPGRQAL